MKILMVCLGNICRSPMAEGVLRHKVEQRGLDISVDSAGTANYHVGDYPDRRAMAQMNHNGIDITSFRGRQFSRNDFKDFDLIFAMDESNYHNIISLADSPEQEDKVDLILNQSMPGRNESVPDPYYGGDEGFEHVFQLLNEACDKLLDNLDVK